MSFLPHGTYNKDTYLKSQSGTYAWKSYYISLQVRINKSFARNTFICLFLFVNIINEIVTSNMPICFNDQLINMTKQIGELEFYCQHK